MYTYVPVLRHSKNLCKVVKRLNYDKSDGSSEDGTLLPILEVFSDDNLEEIEFYSENLGFLLVDFPIHLRRGVKENKYSEDKNIGEFLQKYDKDPVKFYKTYKNIIEVPVISSSMDPIEYETIIDNYQRINNVYNKKAIRIFVSPEGIDKYQQDVLNKVSEIVGKDVIVLLDVLEIEGHLETIYYSLSLLKDIFEENEIYVLNAFEPRSSTDQEHHNYGPLLMDLLDADGIGDYLLEKRYPNPTEDMSGAPKTKIVYHYDSDYNDLQLFKGKDYSKGYIKAFKKLRDTEYWNSDHCEFCEHIENKFTDPNENLRKDPNFWKQMRMGHYLRSILNDTFKLMEEYEKEDLDMDGYYELRKRIEEPEN